jgi:hypothetical protein
MTYIYSAPPNFSIVDDSDLKHHQSAPTTGKLRSFPLAGGLCTVVIDIAPNQTTDAAPMHRTQTLDHMIRLRTNPPGLGTHGWVLSCRGYPLGGFTF